MEVRPKIPLTAFEKVGSFLAMAHIFLNLLVARLRQETTFKHTQFIGNRYLPAVIESHFTYFTYPIFRDVSGCRVEKCAFKHAVSNAINIQGYDWEFGPNEL
jgi:hypothetical protein